MATQIDNRPQVDNLPHARASACPTVFIASQFSDSKRASARREVCAAFVIDQWTRFSSFAHGRSIEIHDGVRRVAGVTRGLNPLGALRIEESNGIIEEVYSGEVAAWN